jgi:hypothetical protein
VLDDPLGSSEKVRPIGNSELYYDDITSDQNLTIKSRKLTSQKINLMTIIEELI